MQIKIKRIENGKLPEYKTVGSAGADCYARIDKEIILNENDTVTVPLGFAVEIPDGYEMQIRPRSGLAKKNKTVAVLGTIDSDYRGEVCAILINHSKLIFTIKPNDRIAQAVVCPIIRAEWYLTNELSETERGQGGFGSTGVSDEKKVEKFYEPFKKISEVKKYLGKEVILDKLYKAILSRVVQTGFNTQLYFKIIGAVKEDVYFESILNHEIEMNVVIAFDRVRIDGHRFGQEIEFE